jgi:hypothetical protein
LVSAVTDRYRLRAVPVVADGLDRTAFHRFSAKSFFLRRLRLLVNVRMTAVIVPFKIGGRSFAAQIAVDALIVHVEFAGYVLGVFVCGIGHGFSLKSEEETLGRNAPYAINLAADVLRATVAGPHWRAKSLKEGR